MKKRFHEGAAPGRLRAFTLVETMTVIALLAITMAFFAPRFVTMSNFSARGYADELAGALRYAQHIARASSCNVRFTVTATSYSAAQRTSRPQCRSHGAWNRRVRLPDGDELTGTAPSGVTVGAAAFEFDSDGGLATATTTLSIGAFVLSIDPVTGRVSVQ